MGEHNTAAEVGVKLVLDSNARAEADKIKDGLKKVDQHAEHSAEGWKHKIGESLKRIAEFAAGDLLAEGAKMGFEKASEAAHEAFEAFEEANKGVAEIASSLMMVDRNSNSFANLKELGWDIHEQLEDISIETGVATQAMEGAFNKLMERGGKTVEQTNELVEKMAYAGKTVPGGLAAITQGYDMMEMGMIRARNPLVQLISAQQLLKGNAKSVAAAMMKMTPEKRMELADKALEKMGGKMKDFPLTLAEMKQSLSTISEKFFVEFGRPIYEALRGPFGKVRDWFTSNQELIYETGAKLGEGIGKAVEIIGPFMEAGKRAVEESMGTINQAMESLFGPGMDLFTYIYENKDSFAETFGAILKDIIKVGSFLIKVFSGIRDIIGSVLNKVVKTLDATGQYSKFLAEENQKSEGAQMRKEIMKKGGLSDEEFNKHRAAFMSQAAEGGQDPNEAAKMFDASYRRAMDDHLGVMKEVEGARDAAMNDDAKNFAKMFDIASKQHDVAAMEYVAKFLEGNQSMQNAIAKEGPEIFKGGVSQFLSTLKDMGDKDIASYLKDKMKPSLGAPSKTALTQNFNGPINVKQDFRDQDPDRVAIVFKREMGKMGSNRLQSRLAAPFGF
jgi:hypothetical protein